MEWDTVLSILTWVGLAFAAGLVGYFGKHLGKVIIARFSKNGHVPAAQDGLDSGIRDYVDKKEDKEAYKLEKKQLKAEKKRVKKQTEN